MASPRPHQQQVLSYEQGTMGVSAVPGSGKTWTLTRLAAQIVAGGKLAPHQEVLVVTLVNASVDNFATRIGELVEKKGLLPEVGYRVSTLHTLAHEIVRQRPDLAGLSEDFHVIDERAARKILSDVTASWLQSHGQIGRTYLADDISDWKRKQVLAEKLPGYLQYVAKNAVRHAKSRDLSPQDLRERMVAEGHLPLAEMAQAVYAGYQKALTVRSAVDFDDLIRFADHILRVDEELAPRLRDQWPYVLEDEAQDSSEAQESILRRITGRAGNWVRVGDPNQAIYESFTTADPRLLRDFLGEADACSNLPASGRSQPGIIDVANELIRWSSEEHPVRAVRGALAKPYIEPTAPGDPQPNPPGRPDRVAFVAKGYTEEEEIGSVARSLKQWLEASPGKTAAVLVPTGRMGKEVIGAFEREGVPYADNLLKLTTATRRAAHRVERVIEYLADPTSPARLARAYMKWRGAEADGEKKEDVKRQASLIAKCDRLEDYLWPGPGASWLQRLEKAGAISGADASHLETFRGRVRYWLGLAGLPIGQLVTALAQDLFSDPDQLALAQKFAGLLRRASSYNPGWGLPQFSDELRVIAENQRKFEGVGSSDTGFDPDAHPGKVAVSTMHRAKGLEWDRVHLLGVNDYNFPAAEPDDDFLPEKWFVRDDLNLQAEMLAQIDAAASGDRGEEYREGEATLAARREYARERLRLLYVGITRAREELIVTTNTGSQQYHDNKPALAFQKLRSFCNEELQPAFA